MTDEELIAAYKQAAPGFTEEQFKDLTLFLPQVYGRRFLTSEEARVEAALQGFLNLFKKATPEIKQLVKQKIMAVEDEETRQATAAAQAGPALEPLPPEIGQDMSKFTRPLGPGDMRGMTSSGPEVTNLQKVLNALGFSLPVTGQFDPATVNAVKAFQTKYHQYSDGLVGGVTRKALNILIGKA